MNNQITQEESFEELKYLYNELKESNEKLEAYTDILESILKYFEIPYPPYILINKVDF